MQFHKKKYKLKTFKVKHTQFSNLTFKVLPAN